MKFSLQIGKLSFNVGADPAPKPTAQERKVSKRSYNAGAISRLTSDWSTTVTSADVEVRNDITKMRSRARDLERNDPYFHRGGRLLRNNVLGWKGVMLRMKAKDPNGNLDSNANSIIEDAWRKWGKKKNCTAQKTLSFRQVCNLVLNSRWRDGGFLIRYVEGFPNEFGFALQLIEIDHLDHFYNVPNYQGNEIRMGVEINSWGEPVAYYLWTRHPGDYNAATAFKRDRIPASEILHLYLPERAHQTIGAPEAAASMSRLNQLNGYEEAEVTAARVGACKGGYIESERPEEFDGSEDGTGNQVEEMEPGVVRQLSPGEKFVEHDPKHPNSAYGPFTKTTLRGAAAGMMMSYNSVANDLEGVNYSSIRAGVLEDREEFKVQQEDFIEDLCEVVFARWLPFAILSGQVALPMAKLQKFLDGQSWQGRRWPWVDPLKDVQASIMALEKRLASRTGILDDNGEDFEELLDEIEEEERLAEEKGVELSIGDTAALPAEPDEDDKASGPSGTAVTGAEATEEPKKKRPKKGI
jgi:lambda family phage portal protein